MVGKEPPADPSRHYGIGKTTLWRDAVANAHELGSLVLSCRPAEAEATLPFAGPVDLLDPVLDDILPRFQNPSGKLSTWHSFERHPGIPRSGPGQSPPPRSAAFACSEARTPCSSRSTMSIGSIRAPRLRSRSRSSSRRLTDPDPRRGQNRGRRAPRPADRARRMATSRGRRRGLGDARDRYRIGAHAPPCGDVPRPRLEALARRSGGNPMFALELARRERTADRCRSRFATR